MPKSKQKPAPLTSPLPRSRAGRRTVEGSSRNGAARVTCFVTPSAADQISRVCAELGITRGELLMRAAAEYGRR